MSRILLITSTLPWPLRHNGGGQRTALLRKALQRFGEVDVLGVGGLQLRDPDVTDEMLSAHGITACFVRTRMPDPAPAPWWAMGPLGSIHDLLETWRGRFRPEPDAAKWLDQRLREPGQHYDLIVGRYLAAALMGGLFNPAARDIPRLLDFDDMEWQTLEAQLQHNPWPGIKGRIGGAMVVNEIRRICFSSLGLFQHVWVTSAEDGQLLPHNSPPHSVLPNIPFIEPGRENLELPPNDEARDVLFVGDLQLPTNRDGLEQFITHAWPTVRAQCPSSVLRVVGRGLSGEQRARWGRTPGVDVVGFSQHLTDFYQEAAVCVVPTFYGGGTKIKVLEALMMNRAVVTTEHALRGYHSLNASGPSVWVAGDFASLAEGCVKLITDVELRTEMASRGHGAVLRDFSWERFQSVVDAAVKPLLETAEPAPEAGLTVTMPV